MRRELCRNFQRGSCQYGARCKFLHSSPQQQQQQQQQPKTNPFGFGSQTGAQQQQQKPNPFGFGVQGGSQHAGSNKPNQLKSNTWSRFSPIPGGGASSHQTGDKPQQADHKCTDPAACKRIIDEDFKNEKPLWKLTCYSHWRCLPCDVVGDTSYEELRATSYDEAKRGSSLQLIVERERNMVNSKLAEFENFLRSPYRGHGSTGIPSQNTGFATSPSMFPPTGQINAPSAFPGFAQQSGFHGTSSGIRPAFPPQSSPGPPPSSFASFNQPSDPFNMNPPQSVPSGPSGFQLNNPTPGSPFASNPAAFITPSTPQSSPFSASVTGTPSFNMSQNQTSLNFSIPNASPEADTMKNSSGMNQQGEAASGDNSIWLKPKWNPGEIPEQAPPNAFV
ncbi:PREDICTED: zinc finger CCCH domain-containing protein 16 [Tarenaya hassleriana]|uniref:zinc finger CCCH domain-containing protein 16 n=1 Tax=Tarenaya hassleriana TaxID=28532 RepID=UPI00053C63AD|nr:PREDICTED: zinc finger CCCH domain-containing protein 16 [Tarenaya hassleriana]